MSDPKGLIVCDDIKYDDSKNDNEKMKNIFKSGRHINLMWVMNYQPYQNNATLSNGQMLSNMLTQEHDNFSAHSWMSFTKELRDRLLEHNKR